MPTETFLIDLILILVAAKIGAEAAERMGLPAVLGELLAGVVVGGGLHLVDGHQPVLALVAQVGVILLMFQAGLESDMDDLFKLGLPALWVATAGVSLSIAGCYALMHGLGLGPTAAFFVGSTLCATSVGITARSFSDLRAADTREAKIVLGAAVADDIIGLIVLAVVSGVAVQKTFTLGPVVRTTGLALAFLVGAIVLGRVLSPAILRVVARMRTRAALSTASLVFCFGLAALSQTLAHLSPIIGAFAAGLVLAKTEHRLHFEDRIRPVADLFIPVFFVLTGAIVPLGALTPGLALRAGLLFVTAAAAKLAAGLSVPLRGVNRLAVGVGMIPRGEVVLAFAVYGIKNRVISGDLYSEILLVVLLTTFVTPPLLKLVLSRDGPDRRGRPEAARPEDLLADAALPALAALPAQPR